ncbi:hypothetical protein BDZ89DRAFT_1089131 [Hymenopellis radicata]|nr:hypothetical protein BDZ89DRAFT_1089131 [Hymenopellis radicata]
MTLHQQAEQTDNHLEFAVPPTAASDAFPQTRGHSRRPFSIDLSLELEHQLEMDSLPSSPAHNATTHEDTQPIHDSLDPQILAHIVMQLRQNLADMTKERDDLLQLVAKSTAKEAELNDALQHMTDKATDLDESYAEAKRKLKDDEEAISMLRTKVEESRRGLMRLQSENRRQSVGPMTLDLSRAGSVFGSPPSSKRASFTPLTGSFTARGHMRMHSDFTSVDDPTGQTLIMADHASTKASRRTSGFFARSPMNDRDPLELELEALRKELHAVKDELEETRHELREATRARTRLKHASKPCASSFQNSMLVLRLLIPPSPLWKVDTSVKPTAGQPSATTPSAATPNSANQMSSSTVPLTRKIGGFFGSRASVSSSNAAIPSQPSHRTSIYSSSDASSVAEPLSPTSEEAHNNNHVAVRTSSEIGSMGGSPPLDNDKMHVSPGSDGIAA